jgi:ribosomal protein RSM22 (predicted rRNA methylase)
MPKSFLTPYPEVLEGFWKDRALRYTNKKDFGRVAEILAPTIFELSDIFTKKRKVDFSDYFLQEKYLTAYGLWFFPQTFARVQFPIHEMIHSRKWQIPRDRAIKILDLGCGLGGASLGLLSYLSSQCGIKEFELHGIDHSKKSLKEFENLVQLWARENKCIVRFSSQPISIDQVEEWKPKKWDIILASFSLGEIFFDKPIEVLWTWYEKVLRKLSDQTLFMILEPSLKETTERLEEWRNLIADRKKGQIWGPCLHHESCPLLKHKKYWCHDVRSWILPRSIQQINNSLHFSVHELKYSQLIISLKAAPKWTPSDERFRLISPIAKLKGKYINAGCSVLGNEVTYEIAQKDVETPVRKKLEKFERGDLLIYESIVPLSGERIYRVEDPEAISELGEKNV